MWMIDELQCPSLWIPWSLQWQMPRLAAWGWHRQLVLLSTGRRIYKKIKAPRFLWKTNGLPVPALPPYMQPYSSLAKTWKHNTSPNGSTSNVATEKCFLADLRVCSEIIMSIQTEIYYFSSPQCLDLIYAAFIAPLCAKHKLHWQQKHCKDGRDSSCNSPQESRPSRRKRLELVFHNNVIHFLSMTQMKIAYLCSYALESHAFCLFFWSSLNPLLLGLWSLFPLIPPNKEGWSS